MDLPIQEEHGELTVNERQEDRTAPCATPSPQGTAKRDGPIVILTGARSGSTLLRRILNAHPDLVCPPETAILALSAQMRSAWETLFPEGEYSAKRSDSIRSLVDAMFDTYLDQSGK